MKMIIKDTFYTLVPINRFLRYTALSNIHRTGIEVQKFGSTIKRAIYILVLTFVNLFFLYQKLNKSEYNVNDGIVKFYDIVQITYWFAYIVYMIDLYFVQKYGGDVLIKYLKIFDTIDKSLGIADYDGIHKTTVISILLGIGTFLFVSLSDYVIWGFLEGWENSSIYAVDYLYWFLNIQTILDVVSHVIQVEFRLKIIKGLLQNKNGLTCIKTIINTNQIATSPEDHTRLNPLKKRRFHEHVEITTLTKCYIQLLEQVNFVNTSYGFRIVVHCINTLFNMINMLNLVIRPVETNGEAISSFSVELYTFLAIASNLLRASNYEFMAIMLTHRCEQAYKQNDKILETIDVLLVQSKHHSETKTNLLEFRNLLLSRPIKFHAAKFFTIDYGSLVSLNSVIVTYTIIIRQNIQ